MEEQTLIIRFGEIALKGRNKPYFEKVLLSKIRERLEKLKSEGEISLKREQGLIILKADKSIPTDKILGELKKVFGIASISPAIETGSDIEEISMEASLFVKELKAGRKIETFKVEGKRSDKTYAVQSPDIGRITGAAILKNIDDIKVDVHNPDLLLHVNVRQGKAYIYEEMVKGFGGMPIGTNGKGMVLLSGGIDSPVSLFMMAKRGMAIEAVHFHSFPYTSQRAEQKVLDLAKILSQYTGKFKVNIINLLPAQEEIMKNCPEDEMVVLSRRFMYRVAEDLAKERDCQFLVTGENLGQVASQTAESLAVTDEAVSIPVLRPLIAFDKTEIIEKAQEIGTFDTSILPYEDCCTVFVPKHPVTKPRLSDILKSEEALDVEEIKKRLSASLKVVEIKP
ncbi:MAG: tRNA uracil 4-sulfurtransferase ThiI [Anaerovoracaceae bacterium]